MIPADTEALCAWIIDKERKLALLERTCLGVGVWEAYRLNVFYVLARRLGILDSEADEPVARESPGLLRLLRELPRWERRRPDFLLVGSRRRQAVDQQPVDPASEAFRRKAANEGKRVAEVSLQPRAQRAASETESIDLGRAVASVCANLGWLARLVRRRLRAAFGDFLAELESELGVPPEALLAPWSRQLIRFHVLRAFSAWMLLVKRPREAVTVAGYGVPWLPAAAKALGIPVTELQHGVISSCHLAYHYPGVAPGRLRYFPDRLVLWSEFWRSSAALPLEEASVSYLPLQVLEELKRDPAIARKRAQVLVVSQATVGAALAEFLERQLPADFAFPVRFRLHPRERRKWRHYAALARLVDSGRVALDTDGTIYPALLASAAVIGCYSTALYEAAELRCRVYVAPLRGSEQMRGFVQGGGALPLDGPAAWADLARTLRAAAG